MKKLFKFIVVLLILLVVIVLCRNIIIEQTANPVIKFFAGVDLDIEDFDIGLTESYVSMKGLSINNPEGFPENSVIYIPELFIDYNHRTLFGDTLHLEELTIAIDEVILEKNSEGSLNVIKVVDNLNEKFGPSEADKKKKKEKGTAKKFQIDVFNLKINSMKIIDNTVSPAKVTVLELNIDESYKDVTNPVGLGAMIALKNTGKVGKNVLTPEMVDALTSLSTAYLTDGANQLIGQGADGAKKFLDKIPSSSNVINKATDKLKSLF